MHGKYDIIQICKYLDFENSIWQIDKCVTNIKCKINLHQGQLSLNLWLSAVLPFNTDVSDLWRYPLKINSLLIINLQDISFQKSSHFKEFSFYSTSWIRFDRGRRHGFIFYIWQQLVSLVFKFECLWSYPDCITQG